MGLRSRYLQVVTLVGVGLLLVDTNQANGAAPAFNCQTAGSQVEKLICGDKRLSALDQQLAKTYEAAIGVLAKSADGKKATHLLRSIQRGWIKGRNECWKSADMAKCTADSYRRQIAELQARYMLRKPRRILSYFCRGNRADEITAYFFDGEYAAVRLERGDTIAVGIPDRSKTGKLYNAQRGVSFLDKGGPCHFGMAARREIQLQAIRVMRPGNDYG